MIKLISTAAILLSALTLMSCSSAKKKDINETANGNASPTIDSTPLSFDVAGSDSQKIEGLTSIHFAYDSSSLTNEAQGQVTGNVLWLKAHRNQALEIEGHCDHVGSIEYNMALGMRRATSVMKFMTSLGIESDRLKVISYGKEKPIDSSDTPEADAKNRRANFRPLDYTSVKKRASN